MMALWISPQAWGFSLLGPYAEWQTSEIGYQSAYEDNVGGPMNSTEDYRWNTAVITYGFDTSFLNFFGSNGVLAVEEAIQTLNSLPNASDIDPAAFPLFVRAVDPAAESLGLLDLKSYTLHTLLEQLGLARPEEFVFTLRRKQIFGTPPITNWLVIQRHFDPITYELTNVINGIPYDYIIADRANPDEDGTFNSQAISPPDLSAGTVAGSKADIGVFFPGNSAFSTLTADDVGGLKFLLRSNNINTEVLLPDVRVISTNNNQQVVETTDLATFLSQARTNDPAALQALYPNLNILSSNRFLVREVTSNFVFFLTNNPYLPGTEGLLLGIQAIVSTNFATNWSYTFANVVTNTVTTGSIVEYQQTLVTNEPYSPAGTGIGFVTNVSSFKFSNYIGGTMYILPTNIIRYIVDDTITDVQSVTNSQVFTNFISLGGSNVLAQTNVDSVIRPSIRYIFSARPVELVDPTNAIARRPGVEKITFVRMPSVSPLGGNFLAVTNEYVDAIEDTNSMSTNAFIYQMVRRTSTHPDILFLAADLQIFPINFPVPYAYFRTGTTTWQNNSALNGFANAAGPGVIRPPVEVTFNSVGPFTVQSAGTNLFLTNVLFWRWASFDNTGNITVYPSRSSIAALEQLLFSP